MILDVKISELDQIKCWNSGASPSGTDYYILYSHKNVDDTFILNIFGSQMGWEYDNWYQVSVDDFSSDILDFFSQRPWNENKQQMLNKIHKTEINTPE
jgi:hypothetical protein